MSTITAQVVIVDINRFPTLTITYILQIFAILFYIIIFISKWPIARVRAGSLTGSMVVFDEFSMKI